MNNKMIHIFFKKLYFVFLFLMSSMFVHSQQNKIDGFKKNMEKSCNYEAQSMMKFVKSNNSYDFMRLGYYINANNNMFLKTNDSKYLDNNLSIIKPILIDKGISNYKTNKWLMKVAKSNQNSSVNGQEHLISEGYFFRYVGEFLDIIKNNDSYQSYQSKILEGLKYSFTKWQLRSFKEYNDYSLLFHTRLHTGANWALTALYLRKYDAINSKLYSEFINQFDEQLKKALKLNNANGEYYYTWNSTYPEKFCQALREVKNYKSVIQDVSHGNHVVLYLIKSKELKNKNWSNFNFNYLVNTLKFKILQNNYIADNVDGTTSKSVKDTGWKISDGWMKLNYFDETLNSIIKLSLVNYQAKIINSPLLAQFNSIYP